MFNRRTLFVCGAGASYEAGLPLGTGLAKIIREKMDVRFECFTQPIGSGDHDLYAHIAHVHRQEADAYQQAESRFRLSEQNLRVDKWSSAVVRPPRGAAEG